MIVFFYTLLKGIPLIWYSWDAAESEMLQICARDKEVSSLYDMFHTRNR